MNSQSVTWQWICQQAIEGRAFLRSLRVEPARLILGSEAWAVAMTQWAEVRLFLPEAEANAEPHLYGMRLVLDPQAIPQLVSVRSAEPDAEG